MNDSPIPARKPRRYWGFWLLPLLALGLTAALWPWEWSSFGPTLRVTFAEGHGLRADAPVRYRGIDVGRVTAVTLNATGDGIDVVLQLHQDAAHLAREDSRFWIVRPQVNWDSVSGLDTLIGMRHVGVLPGNRAATTAVMMSFKGLETPPWAELVAPGGVEVRLQSALRGQLYLGAPVRYREVDIGTVTSVDLNRDASAVEVRLYIKPEYASLIRDTTRFWQTPATRLDVNWWGGLSWEMGAFGQFLRGGVSLAVPPSPGKRVTTNHLFTLADSPAAEWTDWATSLPVNRPEPTAADYPPRLAAQLNWTVERFFVPFSGSRSGQVVVTEQGVLGPRNLFIAPEPAVANSVQLLLADQRQSLDGRATYSEDLALLSGVDNAIAPRAWPQSKQRSPRQVEDVVVIGTDDEPRFVSADKLRWQQRRWMLADSPFTRAWHGAAVMSQQDGFLIGLLVVDEQNSFIALLP